MRNEMQESKAVAHVGHVDRVVRRKELSEILGLSASTIYDRMNPKSKRFDPTFPRPIQLGMASVGWNLSVVMAWIAARPQACPITAHKE
ncbi:AlpA family phage regulatory protein [Aeromonas encheleia]|uniref:helix-turn-helix transcriptional regulator n=1 Tax=Aeromonas encheleia TaxID=73010 RepID=UPI001F581998|nr:AlpA family phage regulatory protein [Aeromonas encheleia]UNP87528.1 AlpA family phage regulatory protein [Aeromonas encheleia]